jgi:hypothetical protein
MRCFDGYSEVLNLLRAEVEEGRDPRVRIHNQNMTTAAKAQAERKTFGHLS